MVITTSLLLILMSKLKHLLAISLLLSASLALGQASKIRGTIIEDSSGEAMIGANVIVQKVDTNNEAIVEGTINGAVTDLEGQFTISVEAGTYTITVSFVTFESIFIEGVMVGINQVRSIGNIRLKQEKSELQEVVVTAKAIRTTEAALLNVKKKAPRMIDGISSAKFKRIGDATAAEAVKRVTGVSIEGGKYVYVRGLGDRYTKTTLNGMNIPGLDPDRNSLQMDIFPTNLIDNMIVSKSFTADLPADFTGGLVNVETKEFPDEKTMEISFGIGFNPSMHFNSDYLAYQGGSTDFLGFDDGSRALPNGARATQVPGPFTGNTEEASAFIRSFNPNLAAKKQQSLMDYNLGFSIGNELSLGGSEANHKPKIGYIFSLSYKNNTRFYNEANYGEYQKFKGAEQYEMRYATTQDGQLGENTVLIGALGGLALKSKHSKLKLTAMRLQSGESRAGQFNIYNDGAAVGQSGYIAQSDNLEYTQSALNNILLNGNHTLNKSEWEIDWRISPTFSTLEDPDIRKTAFSAVNTDNPRFAAGEAGNPSRIWRSLNEFNINSTIDITKKYSLNDEDAQFKFGGNHTFKTRGYEILFFDVQFFGSQSWSSPNQDLVLDDENLFPNPTNGIYYQSGNNEPNPNAYSSHVHNTGFYISNQMTPIKHLKTIIGLRVENFVQRHTGRDQAFANGSSSGRNLANEKVLDSFDFFPAVNLIYSLADNQNLRASYSKTIARPSFKELSFAQILDPITNRIFNGSLFPYEDWDGNLSETRIDNVDLRWELFQRAGQLFSISAFYKYFDNPIELVRIPAQQTSTEFQPRNVGNGQLIGLEIEARKKLDFISSSLQNFNISGNLTFVKSRIDMTKPEFDARKEYEKTGESIDNIRQMAGQAPYVINGGVSYNQPELGLNAGIFYNVKGPTLAIVGTGLYADVYDDSFHSLNFSISKTFGEDDRTIVDFKVSNILNDRRESFYQSFQADKKVFSSLNPGIAFSLGVNYTF